MVTDLKQVSFFWRALEAIPLAGGCCIRSSVVGFIAAAPAGALLQLSLSHTHALPKAFFSCAPRCLC